MAERSTAAVDVADNGGDEPLTAEAEETTADDAGTEEKEAKAEQADKEVPETKTALVEEKSAEVTARPPELHSGHKLARRYRLEECVTRLDGFSSWRAVDEKLRRAVGVHVLPADHPRARPVLAAARSAALLGDPRFVQVLDAVEENDLVYVVHEWLSDAKELTAVLAAGPLEPYDAYQLVSQVSQAMAAAHREGLAHLRLGPGSVLRTESGQYRIRGLAVMAALRGISADKPQRTDTEAIGALLYAALTQRWPYEGDAHGLTGLPKGVGLIAPDQVRAGVHRGLSELAMRALVNDGATASRQDQPCTTPEELAEAVAAMPRIRPPEPVFRAPDAFQRTTYQQGAYRQPPGRGGQSRAPRPAAPVPPPPPLQSRTGRALKWAVSALLIAALGLGSWQLADALLKDEKNGSRNSQQGEDKKPIGSAAKPIKIENAQEFDFGKQLQHPTQVRNTYDGDTSTSWRTQSYVDGPGFKIRPGVGIVYDLGSERKIDTATLSLHYAGNYTAASLYATDSLTPSVPPMDDPVSGFKQIGSAKSTTNSLTVKAKQTVKTRYVLVWLTALPNTPPDGPYENPYKQAITEVKFTG